MDEKTYFAINLAICIAKEKSLEAFSTYIEALNYLFNEDAVAIIYAEVCAQLKKSSPDTYAWLEAQLKEEDIEPPFASFNQADIAHLLVDEGLMTNTPSFKEGPLLINRAAYNFLKQHYDINQIQHLIKVKYKKPKSKIQLPTEQLE